MRSIISPRPARICDGDGDGDGLDPETVFEVISRGSLRPILPGADLGGDREIHESG